MKTTKGIIKVHLKNLRSQQFDLRREHNYHKRMAEEARTKLTTLVHEIVNIEIWRQRNVQREKTS